ncbi:MAG: RNA polymerase sigma factor [Paracoccaceae bacterium]
MSGFHDQLTESLPALWRYAFSLTHDRAAADDLVQDCAERALRKRYLWLPHRPLKPWLMKMLLNTFRNRYRAETARPTVPLDEAPPLAAAGASPEERLDLAQTLRAVQDLPPTSATRC